MKFDTQTLGFILGLSYVTQVIALFVQYRVGNKTYKGIGWWLMGSSLMAVGAILMSLINVKSLEMLVRIANPLQVLGLFLLYVGLVRFFNKNENRGILTLVYFVFILAYYYYMYISNDISSRTVVVNGAFVIITIMIVYKVFSEKDRLISNSANFTAIVFLCFGVFSIMRVYFAISMPPVQTYREQVYVLNGAFIVQTIASYLWTFGFVLMVNQRLNNDNRLEKEKMQMVFNTSPDAASITRVSDGLFVDVNVGFTLLFGYTRDEVLGTPSVNNNNWQNVEDREQFLEELINQRICENKEYVFIRKDGSQFYGMISASIILIQDIPHIISVVHDITERKHAEEALIESEEQYRSILNASPDDITITDLEGRILMISPAAKKMFGYDLSFDNFIGMRLLDFIVPEDVERAQANILQMYQGGSGRPNEYRGVRKDKSIFDIEVNSEFVRNANGQPIKMVFIVRDITERKQTEKHIKELVQQLEIERNTAQLNSITDSLTGLANRRYFDLAFETEFSRLKRSGAIMSLIMLDIDHFKKFNDKYGHLAGDDCLLKIGIMLKAIVGRAPDIVARYGGEEFVVILPETESHGAKAMAERIRKGIEELAIPHVASDTADCITVSLGVVSVNITDLLSPKQIIELADEALYSAKDKGRNQVVVSNCGATFGNLL